MPTAFEASVAGVETFRREASSQNGPIENDGALVRLNDSGRV